MVFLAIKDNPKLENCARLQNLSYFACQRWNFCKSRHFLINNLYSAMQYMMNKQEKCEIDGGGAICQRFSMQKDFNLLCKIGHSPVYVMKLALMVAQIG